MRRMKQRWRHSDTIPVPAWSIQDRCHPRGLNRVPPGYKVLLEAMLLSYLLSSALKSRDYCAVLLLKRNEKQSLFLYTELTDGFAMQTYCLLCDVRTRTLNIFHVNLSYIVLIPLLSERQAGDRGHLQINHFSLWQSTEKYVYTFQMVEHRKNLMFVQVTWTNMDVGQFCMKHQLHGIPQPHDIPLALGKVSSNI
jgi:hypothetical protein